MERIWCVMAADGGHHPDFLVSMWWDKADAEAEVRRLTEAQGARAYYSYAVHEMVVGQASDEPV